MRAASSAWFAVGVKTLQPEDILRWRNAGQLALKPDGSRPPRSSRCGAMRTRTATGRRPLPGADGRFRAGPADHVRAERRADRRSGRRTGGTWRSFPLARPSGDGPRTSWTWRPAATHAASRCSRADRRSSPGRRTAPLRAHGQAGVPGRSELSDRGPGRAPQALRGPDRPRRAAALPQRRRGDRGRRATRAVGRDLEEGSEPTRRGRAALPALVAALDTRRAHRRSSRAGTTTTSSPGTTRCGPSTPTAADSSG